MKCIICVTKTGEPVFKFPQLLRRLRALSDIVPVGKVAHCSCLSKLTHKVNRKLRRSL